MEKKWEYPQLSLAERDRRWREIRSTMAKRGLDCLLIYGDSGEWDSFTADIRYVTQLGRRSEEGFVVFPREGDVTVCLNYGGPLRDYRENSQEWVKDFRSGYKKRRRPGRPGYKKDKGVGLGER